MTETLLSPSNVLLFGRVVADLKIVEPTVPPASPVADYRADLVALERVELEPAPNRIDGRRLERDAVVLLTAQPAAQNGIYRLSIKEDPATDPPTEIRFLSRLKHGLNDGAVILVRKGQLNSMSYWILKYDDDENELITRFIETDQTDRRHGPFAEKRATKGLLESNLVHEGAKFARIYGFSYEGQYFELAHPIFFLVHGDGVPATEVRTGQRGVRRPSRAPGDPSLTGLGAADFEFADDIMVWSYDKADYTIRMDVETGMFEQVLLDACFGDDGPFVSGGRVSGGRVSGGRVSGGRVSGGRVSGGRVSGGRVGGPRGRGDPSD